VTSPPIPADYSRVASASESEETRAVLAVVTQAHRLAAPGSDTWEVLEALGLSSRATEMLRARGAQIVRTDSPAAVGTRDGIGRLRSSGGAA
jgi:hypothetical protein